jgi:hypothetical protein
MADGADMDWQSGKIIDCVALEDAIAGLKAGKLAPGTGVDLGDGVIVEYSGPEEASALLARLQAHARLIDVAISDSMEAAPVPCDVSVNSHAKALLDAIKNAR